MVRTWFSFLQTFVSSCTENMSFLRVYIVVSTVDWQIEFVNYFYSTIRLVSIDIEYI